MNDIFISYANPDRHVAQQLADALEALGWSVWWDREIPLGRAFDQVIEEELNAASCVIVLWTAESARSRWVKTEAAAAADRERLLPVLLEDVPIPLEFRRIQTAMLQGWAGDRDHPEFVRLVDSVRRMLGQPEAPQLVATGKRPRASARPWRWRPKVAAGAAVVVLALLAILIGKTSFRSSEPTPAQPGGAGTPQQGPSASAGAATPAGSSAPTAAANNSPSKAAVKGSFPIRIGDRIDDGVPGPGAGNIESAGAKDIYTFAAAGGQRVYFRMLKYSKDMERIEWKLADPDGTAVFETRLGYSEPGVQVLRKAGTYVMTVGSDREPQVGTYRLQLFDVPPPHQFAIKPGDLIKENTPTTGAGTIESPGAKDVYTFAAAAGQRVYFRMFEYGKDMDRIEWKLTDPDGTAVFETRLSYSEPGVQVLRKAGTYAMTVGSDAEPFVGPYRLQLFNVPPPHQFSIKVGDTIRENTPGAGAGTIESPGAKDVYTFTAAAGQRVYFRMFEYGKGMERIEWKLTDPDGTAVFETRLSYTEPGAQVLRKAGTYTMTVGSDRESATGTYRLQLSNAPGG